MADWLAVSRAAWLAGCLAVWLAGCPAGLLGSCLAGESPLSLGGFVGGWLACLRAPLAADLTPLVEGIISGLLEQPNLSASTPLILTRT